MQTGVKSPSLTRLECFFRNWPFDTSQISSDSLSATVTVRPPDVLISYTMSVGS